MIYFGGVLPLSVEVVARDVRAVVAVNDSIGIQHRDDLKDEVLSKFFGFFMTGNEELDDAVADVGADRLSRMDSGSQNDVTFVDFKD